MRATIAGAGAVLLWATLAALTVGVGPTPPFQLIAICFAIAGVVGLGVIAASGRSLRGALAQPPAHWALGVYGLFGYHFCYFSAIALLPGRAAEASLVTATWPLLIVVFAALLPGGRLGLGHVLGAGLGFLGGVIALSPDLLGTERAGAPPIDATTLAGLGFAACCALVWSSYSVATRLFDDAPTDSVAGFCLAAAALGLGCHLAFETTVWPSGAVAWACVAALGLGPVGAAFFLWDVGCKKGDLPLLGVLSYAAPLLSTALLVVVGMAEPRWTLFAAAAAVAAGSLIAARASFAAASARP